VDDGARAELPVLEIAPTRGWRGVDLPELWAYRELLFILVWRDVKVRYKQTVLGALWVMAQPLATMLIFTFLFHRLARFDAGSVPYALFVMVALLPWNLFAGGAMSAGNSLIGSASIISKIYFPRLMIPTAAIAVTVVDFLVNLVLVAAMMVYYRTVPTVTVLALPLALLMVLILALGTGLWIAALNVEYRDVRIIFPFVLQIAMYTTPVVYPMAVLPPWLRRVAIFNPMTGIVEMFRASLLGTSLPRMAVFVSAVVSVLLLWTGTLYFRRMERSFADVI
jgi:lipopolysaccharide transport system permease protein